MVACTTFQLKDDIFVSVEECMEVSPDSALHLLNSIEHPEKLRGKQAAHYALLMTLARDKNYLDSLQSDSLISIAAKYDWKDDNAKAGKSWYYYGKVLALKSNTPMQWWLMESRWSIWRKQRGIRCLALSGSMLAI